MSDAPTDPSADVSPPADVTLSTERVQELLNFEKEYKGMQRNLDRAKRSGSANTDTLQAGMDALSAQVAAVVDTLASGGYIEADAKEKLQAMQQRATEVRDSGDEVQDIANEIGDILADAGDADWDSDPRLADARSEWERAAEDFRSGKRGALGRFSKARRLVEKATATPADTKPNESLVEDAVQAELKRAGVRAVDLNESSAGGARTRTAEQFYAMPAEYRRRNAGELRKILSG